MDHFVVGISDVSFTASDGKSIRGKRFHFISPVPSSRGSGFLADNVFLSDSRLSSLSFVPSLSDHVQLLYNRYGKVSDFVLLDPIDVSLPS